MASGAIPPRTIEEVTNEAEQVQQQIEAVQALPPSRARTRRLRELRDRADQLVEEGERLLGLLPRGSK
jgi:hypothetical protein